MAAGLQEQLDRDASFSGRSLSTLPASNGLHSSNPWAISSATATLEVSTPQDHVGLVAQRQLAAVDLLLNSTWTPGFSKTQRDWTPNRLCKASKLTLGQLQQLVQEHI